MSNATPRHCYPLYFTGIPGWIVQILRSAGVAIEEMTTAKWHSELRKTSGRPDSLILFDSQTAASRQNADAFRQQGCQTLDTAGLLQSQPIDETVEFPPLQPPSRRRRILDRAKRQIEAAGFLWARIADYPYPFQAALIDHRRAGTDWETSHELRRLVSPSMVRTTDHTSKTNTTVVDVDDLLAQYAAGYAIDVPSELPPMMSRILDSALGSGVFSLLWRTSPQEFDHWRCVRQQIRYAISESDHRYEIRYGELPVRFRPALEVWRGGHFALMPFRRSTQSIDASQLVFRTAGNRHPAGIAILEPKVDRPPVSQSPKARVG